VKFVAEHGHTFMSVYSPSRVIKRWFDGYRQAAEEAGRTPDPEKIAYSVPIYVAETDEQAHREAREHLLFLFRKGLKQGTEIVWPPGYMTPSSMRGLLMSGSKPFSELTYEDMVAHDYAIVGSPDTVANRLGELQAELGFGQIIGLFALGDMSHERTVRSMELFSEHVMPALRSLGVANSVAGDS
jgi:alkanesulfonate monooxygenase SsuD/methylene tetrahydromethanopterin reductase-like flavin-dependent oxidoreductase (luciferase family)